MLDIPLENVDTILDAPPTGDARIEEIDVRNPSIRTSKGIHVGSSAAEVLAAYPGVSQVNSEETAAYAAYVGGSALVFRFSVGSVPDIPGDAKVSDMSATRKDVVTAAELCA